MREYYFEKLEIWILAKKISVEIYKVTEKFPKSEIYGLTNQVRRAAVSVASNIAEGSGRTSNKDKAHFIQLTYGSLMEVLNQLIISYELNYICEKQYNDFRKNIEHLSNKLNSFRKALLSNKK